MTHVAGAASDVCHSHVTRAAKSRGKLLQLPASLADHRRRCLAPPPRLPAPLRNASVALILILITEMIMRTLLYVYLCVGLFTR